MCKNNISEVSSLLGGVSLERVSTLVKAVVYIGVWVSTKVGGWLSDFLSVCPSVHSGSPH